MDRQGKTDPEKGEERPIAGEVMDIIFWDAEGILLVDHLKKRIMLTFWISWKKKSRQKMPGLTKKKVLHHQDNTPSHKVVKVIRASTDYSLSLNLKKFFAGKKCESDSEVIATTNAYFADLDESAYKEGIQGLEHRWRNCIYEP